MFSAYELGIFIEKLKAVSLRKLKTDELEDLINCVGTLETSMVAITSCAIELNSLDAKLKLIPDNVDIITILKGFSELDISIADEKRPIVDKNLSLLKETQLSIIKVLKFLKDFPPLKEDQDKPKIILL